MAALPITYSLERHQIAVVYHLDGASGSSLRILLDDIWAHRQCFVCGLLGGCQHREPYVDLAELEAIVNRIRGSILEAQDV